MSVCTSLGVGSIKFYPCLYVHLWVLEASSFIHVCMYISRCWKHQVLSMSICTSLGVGSKNLTLPTTRDVHTDMDKTWCFQHLDRDVHTDMDKTWRFQHLEMYIQTWIKLNATNTSSFIHVRMYISRCWKHQALSMSVCTSLGVGSIKFYPCPYLHL
jgi:hypothetical protein